MKFYRNTVLWRWAAAAALVLAACSARAQEAKPEAARTNAIPIARLKRSSPVDFEKEILPILKNNCLACHNTTKAKGGLNLETPQLILKGGDSGPAVSPGKSANFYSAMQ